MQESVVEQVENQDLAIFVVWIPMYPFDSEKESATSMRIIPDKRAQHYWDAERTVGKAFSNTLGLPDTVPVAWDIYFVFNKNTDWQDEPPKPSFWMHQLGGIKSDGVFLDGDELRLKITDALR